MNIYPNVINPYLAIHNYHSSAATNVSLCTYHRIGVLDQLILGHIIDFLRLLQQVAQEVLQFVCLNIAAVVAVVLAPDLFTHKIKTQL